MDVYSLIGRKNPLFDEDFLDFSEQISEALKGRNVLIVGGAGTIGMSVVKEVLRFEADSLSVVDISENNLVELVREIRSSPTGDASDFRTFALDVDSKEFDAFYSSEGPFDYIFNLSALKHVRSEKDPFTLHRLVQVNVFNSVKLARLASRDSTTKYFCVSTDKAANPVNMMGASKRIMELFLARESTKQSVSFARFANVAFSDGSLLHGFEQRFLKSQPLSAPEDIRRYFVTKKESGQLCLLSCVLGENREIFFPKLKENFDEITFSRLAVNFLEQKGYEPYLCKDENEARVRVKELIPQGKWPCYFFKSDTSGEKDLEEFYTQNENLVMNRFKGIGVVKIPEGVDYDRLDSFEKGINKIKRNQIWRKEHLVELFRKCLGEFDHLETGKNLDQRM